MPVNSPVQSQARTDSSGLFLVAAKIRKIYAEDLAHDDFMTASPRRQYLQQQCHEIGDPWQVGKCWSQSYVNVMK
jgi:hypothetical protein